MTDEYLDQHTEEALPSAPVEDPLEAVRAINVERRGNLAYIGPIYLHEGPHRRIIARICQIYRHTTGDLHHLRLELYYFKRQRVKDQFVADNQITLEGAALNTLLTSLRRLPEFESIDEVVDSLLLPLRVAPDKLSPAKLGCVL